MTGKTRYTAAVLLIAVCSVAYSQDSVPALDAGNVKNSVYTNAFLGMQLRIPDEWHVQDNDATKAMFERGKTIVAGDDKNLNAAIRDSEQKSLTLLCVFKQPPGAPVDFNPSFMCLAEKISGLPGISKGSDYLFHVKKGLSSPNLQVSFEKPIYDSTIAGLQFGVLETKLAIGQAVIRQKYYATILKGYALTFIISYSSEQELQTHNRTLESIKFRSGAN
jgi:hypothetical protein